MHTNPILAGRPVDHSRVSMAPKCRRALGSLLTRIQPAGVILFARNIVSANRPTNCSRTARHCVSDPLFTCVDMEGGKVDRFRNVTGPAPSAAEVYATRRSAAFSQARQGHWRVLPGVGVQHRLCARSGPGDSKHRAAVMSSRAVSADPKEAVLYAREFLAGLRRPGSLGAIKHFPGLGRGESGHPS